MPKITEASPIDELCERLTSSAPRIKYGSARALCAIAQQSPEMLYPRFDFFVRLLDDDKRILRWSAARILGSLAPADREDKLEAVLDRCLAPILGKELIAAANAIRAAAPMACAKPRLAGRIAAGILKVSRARYATPECRNVAIGHAIESLNQFFPHIQNQKTVVAFVEAQLKNSRPATRKQAGEFLKRWGAGVAGEHPTPRAAVANL